MPGTAVDIFDVFDSDIVQITENITKKQFVALSGI